MITMEQEQLGQRPMKLRHAIRDGHDVGLTFRNSVYAAVVPWAKREQELAELAELRARVAELEQQREKETA